MLDRWTFFKNKQCRSLDLFENWFMESSQRTRTWIVLLKTSKKISSRVNQLTMPLTLGLDDIRLKTCWQRSIWNSCVILLYNYNFFNQHLSQIRQPRRPCLPPEQRHLRAICLYKIHQTCSLAVLKCKSRVNVAIRWHIVHRRNLRQLFLSNGTI